MLLTNADNPTGNALHQRLGYVRITDWAVHDFASAEPGAVPGQHSAAFPPARR